MNFAHTKNLVSSLKKILIATVTVGGLFISSPVLAHHPFGGQTPVNVIQGFLSGIGHPIIGLDHLAFVIASGLLAALVSQGIVIPILFVLASMLGTGIHLMSWDLPAAELIISASVVIFGLLLTLKNPPKMQLVASLAGLAGIFHGYAYGEAIVGAEMGPVVAYLLGFASIQLLVAGSAYAVAQQIVNKSKQGTLPLRFAGFLLLGFGSAFLSSIFLG